MNLQMKRVDFENGTITSNILGASLPMLVAQILSLLYNIVDRIYIARIPHIGTAAPHSAIYSAAAVHHYFRLSAAKMSHRKRKKL